MKMVRPTLFSSCSMVLLACFLVQWFIFFVLVVRNLRHDSVCMSQDEFESLRNHQCSGRDKIVDSRAGNVLHDGGTTMDLESENLAVIDPSMTKNTPTVEDVSFLDDPMTGSAIKQTPSQDATNNVTLDCPSQDKSPPLEYERTRRRARMGVVEFWLFMISQIKSLRDGKKIPGLVKSRLSEILHKGAEFYRSLLRDVEKLSQVDGFGSWRDHEEAVVSSLIQRRLRFLHNPKDCDRAKRMVCSYPEDCDYGCRIHHLHHCLIMAYGTNRTMIMSRSGWREPSIKYWVELFHLLGDPCTVRSAEPDEALPKWTGDNNDLPVVLVPPLQNLSDPRSRVGFCLPPSVPRDLVGRISKFHGFPFVWWSGQILKHLTKPQPWIKQHINETLMFQRFEHPIVGVHIRRSDKIGWEAEYHPVEEYMDHVEEYFTQLSLSQQSPVKKRIYLASDEKEVFEEIEQKYPSYEIVGDPEYSYWAGHVKRRQFARNAVYSIITDLHFLANSDFLVCTFSSQVCRLAYEYMQTLRSDATYQFRSLDDRYYFGGQGPHSAVVVLNHNATSSREINLEIGDVIEMKGNFQNGYAIGRNLRSNNTGIFPYFKVEDLVESEDCPKYGEVPLEPDESELEYTVYDG